MFKKENLKGAARQAARAALLAGSLLPALAFAFPQAPTAHHGARIKVVASGLKDPRGLAVGSNGKIYVAEAGDTTGVLELPKALEPTPGFGPPYTWEPTEPPIQTRCEVYFAVGPATPGYSGRISRVAANGTVTTVADGLASFGANLAVGGDRMGVAALAFAGEKLYGLLTGGGCSHGHPSEQNALLRVRYDGTTEAIADLSNFLRTNVDSKDPAAADYEPDGTWYSMVRAYNAFYAVEPNRGVLVRINGQGGISRVADLIALAATVRADHDGDQTWSTLVHHGDHFYLGTLGRINFDAFGKSFKAKIYRLSRDGSRMKIVASGLRGVLGIAFDRRNRMYVLETTAAGVDPPLTDPTAGRLVRVEADGSLTPIVTGLAFPTALTAGRNGEFYISNCGYHCDDPPGSGQSISAGQILRVVIPGGASYFEGNED